MRPDRDGFDHDLFVVTDGRPGHSFRVRLGAGRHATRLWTCDLSYDYVRINAEYHT